jgi:hypothetical protein
MSRSNIFDALSFGGTRWDDGLGLMRQTLTGNLSLSYGGANVHAFVASGGNRVVALPSVKSGKYFFIGNSGLTNTITVNDALGAALATLTPGQSAYFLSSAIEWLVLAPGITSRPPPNTLTKGIDIVQSGPTSGTTPGPWSYNSIDVTDGGNTLTGSGRDAFNLFKLNSAALRINATHSDPSPTLRYGGIFATNFVGNAGDAESVGLMSSAYTNNNAGHLWGFIGYASLGPTGDTQSLISVAAEISAEAGSSVLRRTGFLAITEAPVQGSMLDAAFTVAGFDVGNGGPGGFKSVITVTRNWFGSPALDPLADFFLADGSMSIANWANLGNVTVLGEIMRFPNLVIPGAAAGFTLPAHVSGAFQYGGTNVNGVQMEIDAFTGPALFYGKRANTSSTAPSAVLADQTIAAFVGLPYDGAGYPQTGAIGVRAGQDITPSAHGTFLAFFTTPRDTTTLTEQMRLHMSGGLGIGTLSPIESAYATILLGGNVAIQGEKSSSAGNSLLLSQNAFNSAGSNWQHINTGVASNYFQFNGTHNFRVAASGAAGAVIAWIDALKIKENGRINIPIGLTNAVDDAAAVAAGVAVNDFYRNGSVVMMRVA